MKKQDPTMQLYARELRSNATVEENTLWYRYLRRYPVRWYRQRIIGPFIADFYCKSLKIVIELDGSQHYEEESMAYDKKRSAYFESLGIEVIRFTNTDIKTRFAAVCDAIDLKVAQRQQHP